MFQITYFKSFVNCLKLLKYIDIFKTDKNSKRILLSKHFFFLALLLNGNNKPDAQINNI